MTSGVNISTSLEGGVMMLWTRRTRVQIPDLTVWISSSSSSLSSRAVSMDLPDPLSQFVSIVHRSRQVFQATSCIGKELLYIGSSWSFCLCWSMWRGPRELMSSSLLLLQCPVCLARLTWIVFSMGGRWPYNCCFVGCCLQDLEIWISHSTNTLGKDMNHLFFFQLWVNSWADWLFNLAMATSLKEGKTLNLKMLTFTYKWTSVTSYSYGGVG